MAETGASPTDYGVSEWKKCSKCGVTQPPRALKDGQCIDTAWCTKALEQLKNGAVK